MFEIGKIYKAAKYDPDHRFRCLFVDGENAVGYDFYSNRVTMSNLFSTHTAHEFTSAGYSELPPEPKRWSEWRNCWFGGTRLGNTTFFSLSEARKASGDTTYTIRFDWEQVEGKAKKLLKTELVGVPDA